MPQEIKKLLEISVPRTFDRGEYIFYENQHGSEMYIVLSGSVGIYIDSFAGDHTLVDSIKEGGFFGEMAVFDKGRRSASAAALEETICMTVTSENLNILIENCPQITHKILSSLSARIRSLNDQLYHFTQEEQTYELKEFQIPEENESCNLLEEQCSEDYLDQVNTTCPICKCRIQIPFVRYAALECEGTDPDLRVHYKGFDPLWHTVSTCSECGYANLDSEFLKECKVPLDIVNQVIAEQRYYVNARYRDKSRFSKIMSSYYKALHFNCCFYPENLLVQARLWLKMYWLYQDAGADQMMDEARKKAIACYKLIYDKRETMLHTSGNQQRCAAIIGELYFQENDAKNARYYLQEVLSYQGETLKVNAFDRIYELREQDLIVEKPIL